MCIFRGPILLKCLSILVEELLFCFLPYTVQDLLTSAASCTRNTLDNTEIHSEKQTHRLQTIRLLLLAGSGVRDEGTRGSAAAGEGCDGSGAGVRPGALAALGRAGQLPEPGWSCWGEAGAGANSAVPSRWLQSIWVSQLRAGLPLYPRHTPASRRPADTLPLIYRHRFVVRSRCLRDSADFTLA